MVLQRGPQLAHVWGTAAPSSTVTLALDAASYKATASASGAFSFRLPAQRASVGRTLSVTGDGRTVTFTNVAFGDVYLCSGQSNMQLSLHYSWGGPEAIAASTHYPNVRLFNLPPQASLLPLDAVGRISYEQGWVLPSNRTLFSGNPADSSGVFSAACWYTGRDVYDAANGTVPVGLLQSSYGGTVVEAWTSIERNAECGPIPPLIPHENNTANQPAACYNAMIHPLLNYTLGAILWYQGS